MEIRSPVHAMVGGAYNARAERVADQHCGDSPLKAIATVIAVLAIIIFGALLIIEWPALLLPAALVTGIWAYDCIREGRFCCCS